jgi:hypothetical protein
MSAAPTRVLRDAPPPIALRRFEERTRALSLDAQMVECVDLLQMPELLVADLPDSVEEARADKETGRAVFLRSNEGTDRSAFFYPSRELFVNGDGCSFTCLATDVDFVDDGLFPSPPLDGSDPLHGAIDYAAVTCEARPVPMLGFTQRGEAESAYPLLLRGLSTMIELLRPRRLDLLDREVYRGLLGPAPCLDATLVVWDDDPDAPARRPLCELARDLAETLKDALLSEPGFPPLLRDIVCLRMNDKRFDGRLRFVWRV